MRLGRAGTAGASYDAFDECSGSESPVGGDGTHSSERADLVHRLIRSLEGEPDPDAEVLWQKEIERRALEAVRGESPGCDVDVVMADVRQRLRRV